MRVLLLMCGMLILGNLALAKEPNLEVLRDVICGHETQGVTRPEQFIRTTGELGRCQIKPGTARQVGYRGSNWRLLTDKNVNLQVALVILQVCQRLYGDDVRRIAYCYTAGLSAPYRRSPPKWRYAKQRAIDYAMATMPTTRMRVAKWK